MVDQTFWNRRAKCRYHLKAVWALQRFPMTIDACVHQQSVVAHALGLFLIPTRGSQV